LGVRPQPLARAWIQNNSGLSPRPAAPSALRWACCKRSARAVGGACSLRM